MKKKGTIRTVQVFFITDSTPMTFDIVGKLTDNPKDIGFNCLPGDSYSFHLPGGKHLLIPVARVQRVNIGEEYELDR